jgi:hypothetical protein
VLGVAKVPIISVNGRNFSIPLLAWTMSHQTKG